MTSSASFSPAVAISSRRQLPDHLYVVVDDVAFPTISPPDGSLVTPAPGDFHTKQQFACEYITYDRLRAHFRHRSSSTRKSCFISTFESEGTYPAKLQAETDNSQEIALKSPPFCASGMTRKRFVVPHPTKLIINTSKLHAGWIDTSLGRLPVWLEHGELPKVPKGVLYMTPEGVEAFEASIWICVAEVRSVLGLKPHHGHQGEWLACGHIPRTMVGAQVVLQEYQRQENAPLQPALRKGGSIRSISSEEQEDHIKRQIARNKASRENLQTIPLPKKQGRDKGNSLLRKATENRQLPGRGDSEAADSSPAPSESVIENRVDQDSAYRYASVRSSKLREALERNQASKSSEFLQHTITATKQHPLGKKDIPVRQVDLHGRRHSHSSDYFDRTSGSLSSPAVTDSKQEAQREGIIAEEEKESLPRSERLRRARAGKKKVGFVDPEDEVDEILKSVVEMSDTASILNEVARTKVKFVLPEPPLSSDCESLSEDPPSITDEDPPLSEDGTFDEGGFSDPQTFASERTFPHRARGEMQREPTSAHEPRSKVELARQEPKRDQERSSRFLEDLGSDINSNEPRHIKTTPRDMFGVGLIR
ncbi:hypothetical protein EJ07DRAFT_158674 [Lizonia empirigonia]|nr:hypothetical protein EJ07DRAFT_158674 [Lizonia empirigonia]